MDNKNKLPLPGIGSGGNSMETVLFGQLESLNTHVNEVLSDKDNQKVARNIGIGLLAKKYPALSLLLRGIAEVQDKKEARKVAKPSERHAPVPEKKHKRGL